MTTATLAFLVTEDDTAPALGSGDVPVLATPRLVAWLEAATVAAYATGLAIGTTTVGVRVDVRHTAASPVGATVTATATVAAVDGRTVTFAVSARHAVGGEEREVATGEVTRAVVDRDRFLARLPVAG